MLSKLESYLIGLVVLVLLGATLIFYGEHRYAAQQKAQWAAAAQAKQAELTKARQDGIVLTQKLAEAEAKQAAITKTIIRYIPKKEIIYVHQAPVSGSVTISLNDLFVWNSASQGSLAVPSPAFGVAGSSADSGVTLQSVLGNYAANAAICLHNTKQLQALIQWEQDSKPAGAG